MYSEYKRCFRYASKRLRNFDILSLALRPFGCMNVLVSFEHEPRLTECFDKEQNRTFMSGKKKWILSKARGASTQPY